VREYAERFYLPAAARFQQLTENGAARARSFAAWKSALKECWHQIGVTLEEMPTAPEIGLGQPVQAKARVRLGGVMPEDVRVELFMGSVDSVGEIVGGHAELMHPIERVVPGEYIYGADVIPPLKSGLHGYTVRVLPNHPDLVTPFLPGLVVWAKDR
jgi:starch phosphorylase